MHKNLFAVSALAFCLGLSVVSCPAATITEDFSTDPTTKGWGVFGEGSLFHWNPTNQNLEVTWDSSRPNSYFYHPLGTVLSKCDDFSFSFDLNIQDMVAGVNPEKTETFQFSIGLLNHASATSTNFLRGTGADSPNLVEFDYFPKASTVKDSFSLAVTSTNCDWAFANAVTNLTLGDVFHLALNYTASNQNLALEVTKNALFYTNANATLDSAFTDFRVDAFSITSYSDVGQYPGYEGSILAHGTIDNVTVTIPPLPVDHVISQSTNGIWQVNFNSYTNWAYRLEASTNFTNWATVSSAPGNGATLTLQDTNHHASQFYRVAAEKP